MAMREATQQNTKKLENTDSFLKSGMRRIGLIKLSMAKL